MNRRIVYAALGMIGLACTVVFNRLAELARLAWEGEGFVGLTDRLAVSLVREPLAVSWHPTDLTATAALLLVLLMLAAQPKRNFRWGEEHGSARWGTKRDIAPFVDPSWDNNLLLTDTERLAMQQMNPKKSDTDRNKNVLVIGGSGSGKTRYFVKPNALQGQNSLVITDPKGTLPGDLGRALLAMQYEVKVFDVKDAAGMRRSLRYNPFAYVKNEADILTFVETLIVNTKGDGKRASDDFWERAERLYFYALVGYMFYVLPPEERNMASLLTLMNLSGASEQDESFKSPVDLLFDELEEEQPDNFAVAQYRKYKMAAGKTAKSVLISCGVRLAPFDIAEVRDLMEYDELELDTLGDVKTVLFVLTSDTNKTFNFIAALLYTQLFNLLCQRADSLGGRLPIHVQCLLDEFANIGRIPNFEELISVIRSRNISACILLQSRAQLEGIYDKKADIIIDNCDSFLLLGGKGQKTLEDVVKLVGRQTIDTQSDNRSRGSQKSDGASWQKTGRDLMTADELAALPKSKCVLHITGLRPFLSDKFRLEKHPRYRLLADYDAKNGIDLAAHRGAPLPPTEKEFTYIDMTQQELWTEKEK